MAAVNLVITGRVQGVGFRHFVREAARSLGVNGKVWNRYDGAVETYAEHEDPAALERFAAVLRNGPGEVRQVESQPIEPQGWQGFEIGSTRS